MESSGLAHGGKGSPSRPRGSVGDTHGSLPCLLPCWAVSVLALNPRRGTVLSDRLSPEGRREQSPPCVHREREETSLGLDARSPLCLKCRVSDSPKGGGSISLYSIWMATLL